MQCNVTIKNIRVVNKEIENFATLYCTNFEQTKNFILLTCRALTTVDILKFIPIWF